MANRLEFLALPCSDWSRPLPRSLTILDDDKEFLRLVTLADVRELIRHVPNERRDNLNWQHVAAEFDRAAVGADPADVSVALRMVLSMEGVECRRS